MESKVVDMNKRLGKKENSILQKNNLNNTHSNNYGNVTYSSGTLIPDIDEGKFIDKERIIKFYIGSESGCHVDINDTIIYQNNQLKSPIEHKVVNNFHGLDYNISPKGVYSENVDVEYFGFSKMIKTFSTFFKTKNSLKVNNSTHPQDVSIEYIYTARNLIQSFSDFRNDSSYDNITLNYNLFTWHFKNENDNREPQKLKIEFYFDLGETFQNEKFNVSIPMEKIVLNKIYERVIPELGSNQHTIVKFTNSKEIILPFNESMQLDFVFPLYFENCKNYNLNFLVVFTGFMLIGFLAFVLYRIILIIFDDEKDDNFNGK
jgi:hypothetical protein